LNIGLVTDREVLDYVLKHSKNIPINSLEGYIRQLIGWRNYILLFYEREGEKIRKMNFFKHHRKMSNRWWLGKTGIPVIDQVIQKVEKYSYAHHIERLMILGNFMLICGLEPIEINNWFMSFVSIDAYDVFMIPNVMGMSQFADGGIMMTRPYFSSSNYIKKMSNEKWKGTIQLKSGEYEWDIIFDTVYYNFINEHQDYLKKNYSIVILLWKNI
jgi:deoxyribodipyrimidine photolyase-related protein